MGGFKSKRTSVLIRKRDTKGIHPQKDDHLKRHQDGGHLTAKKGLRGNQTCQHPDLGLLQSRSVEKNFVVKATQSVVFCHDRHVIV